MSSTHGVQRPYSLADSEILFTGCHHFPAIFLPKISELQVF